MSQKCSKYIVAYLDILGAKNKIEKDEENFLKNLNSVLKSTYEMKKEKMLIGTIFQNLELKVFSDNLVFALEFSEDKAKQREEIKGIINLCALLQCKFLEEQIFVRGGITIGNFYIGNIKNNDKNFIYGKALVEAYNLEANIAIYPRIILSERVKDYYSCLEEENRIKKDTDSIYFVNFLNANKIKETIEKYPTNIKKMEQNIISEFKYIESKKRNEKEKQKLNWLKNYIVVYKKEISEE